MSRSCCVMRALEATSCLASRPVRSSDECACSSAGAWRSRAASASRLPSRHCEQLEIRAGPRGCWRRPRTRALASARSGGARGGRRARRPPRGAPPGAAYGRALELVEKLVTRRACPGCLLSRLMLYSAAAIGWPSCVLRSGKGRGVAVAKPRSRLMARHRAICASASSSRIPACIRRATFRASRPLRPPRRRRRRGVLPVLTSSASLPASARR
jgi:hypothetical protein